VKEEKTGEKDAKGTGGEREKEVDEEDAKSTERGEGKAGYI
jgi:hypothetical protein